jgi:hypothetical protein
MANDEAFWMGCKSSISNLPERFAQELIWSVAAGPRVVDIEICRVAVGP